eukprot:914413-Rhodomonas_salina.2
MHRRCSASGDASAIAIARLSAWRARAGADRRDAGQRTPPVARRRRRAIRAGGAQNAWECIVRGAEGRCA